MMNVQISDIGNPGMFSVLFVIIFLQSIWGAVKRIKASEGLRGFYKGFGPTLLTGVPYVSLQMTFFELYNRYVATMVKKKNHSSVLFLSVCDLSLDNLFFFNV